MYRGTTPTNTFRTTVDLSSAEVMYITYGQRGETVVEKEKADITFDVPQEPGQIKNKSGSEEEPTIYSFSVKQKNITGAIMRQKTPMQLKTFPMLFLPRWRSRNRQKPPRFLWRAEINRLNRTKEKFYQK